MLRSFLFLTIPPGTLAANLVGGCVIGLAIAFFSSYTDLSPEWRLVIVTGFCGGLTTFSIFSAEFVGLMQQQRLLAACAAAAAHVGGAVIMTFARIGTIAWIKS